jgi:hydrogenase expression/formation protein HypC
MCLAIPGKILKIEGHKATVKYPGKSISVFVGDEKVKKGDFVMVQMGIVTRVLSEKETLQSLKAWNSF